jgi:hypothetical protein
MATQKTISGLTPLTAAGSTDDVPIVDNSGNDPITKRITFGNALKSVPAGQAATPGLAFAGDTDTGIAGIAADQLALVTGGQARLTVGSTGDITIGSNLIVDGTTTTISSETLLVEDKNIELGTVASPSNATADGGGITLKGATDKTIKWINSTGAWTFNQPISVTGTAQFSGNVTLGDDKIILYASGGGASFAGNVTPARIEFSGSGISGKYINSSVFSVDTGGSATLNGRLNAGADGFDNRAVVGYNDSNTAGSITANNYTSTGPVWQAYDASVDTSTPTSSIFANGAALFEGEVHIGTSTYAGNGQVAIAGNSSGSSAAGILDIRPTLSRPTAANTTLSLIRFGSADHTGNTGYASINMASDGASASDSDIPGRLEFHTTNDSASSPTEKVRIDRMGRVGINSFSFADSATALLIKNGSAGNEHTWLDMVCDSNESLRIRFSEDGSTFPGEIRYETLNNRLLITVNSDERMRIDENGLLSTYGTGNTTNLKLRNSASSSSDIYFIESYQGATSTTAGGTQKFAVATNGGISNVQSNNVDLCDEREKKNIVDLETKWDKVKSWELKKFHYNEDADTDDLRYGVIAQQIETVCPEVLADWHKQRAEDAVLDEDGNVVTPAVSAVIRKGVKEQQMMWMAIKALQEAQARIETLEAKVAALES